MKSYLHRRDEKILGTFYADYELYGVKFDGSRAYLKVEYTERLARQFTTVVIDPDDSRRHYYRHPRRCRVPF